MAELSRIFSFFVRCCQVGNKPVYGVAIPTVDGIRRVLELIGAGKYESQRVLWHNLREEPVRSPSGDNRVLIWFIVKLHCVIDRRGSLSPAYYIVVYDVLE